MHNTQPVTFANRAGNTLFGILHLPDETSRRDTVIILLSPGVKNRIAPHRLYIKLARVLVGLGYPVLRYDFYGLGDSEGELSERMLPDIYTSIQQGLYIDDTRAAIDWLQQEHGFRRFIVGGLCGGAITGLLTGQVDKRVSALLGIGIPVILDNAGEQKTQTLTSSELDHYRGKYFRKLTDIKSIIRLLTFQSDFKAIFKSLYNPVKKRLHRKSAGKIQAMKNDPTMINFNFRFPDAFASMLASGQDIGLFFGQDDRLYWEFKEKYCAYFPDTLDRHAAAYSIYLTPGARHIFERKDQQADLFNNVRAWLEKVA